MLAQVNQGLVLQTMEVLADGANYPIVFGCMTGKERVKAACRQGEGGGGNV